MERASAYLFLGAVAAAVAAWSYYFHAWSNSPTARRSRSPLSLGLTATAASALFLVAGLVGLDLSNSHGFFAGARRIDGVIWWQVVFGVVLAPVALFLLRRGVRDLSQTVRRV